MGFHVCEYCRGNAETSSGDYQVTFTNGAEYCFPDMLPHYVLEHGYWPPEDFVMAVTQLKPSSVVREQTKSVPRQIGYLNGPFKGDKVEPITRLHFLAALATLMRELRATFKRTQTRGVW